MAAFRPRLLEASDPGARMDALASLSSTGSGRAGFVRGISRGVSLAIASDAVEAPLRIRRALAPLERRNGDIRTGNARAFASGQLGCILQNRRQREQNFISLGKPGQKWDCRTLSEGDDPPVWCHGFQTDNSGDPFSGEKLVCESLSRFLTTFVLQELTFGSKFYLIDEKLSALMESEREAVVPLWTEPTFMATATTSFSGEMFSSRKIGWPPIMKLQSPF